MDKTQKMKKIRDEVWELKDSPLYKERISNDAYPVLGEGSHDAEIVLIGEAPGKNEAEQGRPFCGAAGRILDELLLHIGIYREDVYITNIVKDRPPNNRDPLPEEIELYAPFLDRQIEAIRPKVIVTLGRFSMQYILDRYGKESETRSISQIHGQKLKVYMSYGEISLIPMFHPAVALYNGSKKDELKKDFEILKKYSY
ncbi:MAG: uracil-DNA glycosylase family protein [Candidatus Paceibacterota bacterium]